MESSVRESGSAVRNTTGLCLDDDPLDDKLRLGPVDRRQGVAKPLRALTHNESRTEIAPSSPRRAEVDS